MAKSVYLSPSTQENNVGAGSYGTEEKRCNMIGDITEKILKNHGVKVYRNSPSMSLSKVVSDSNSKGANIHFAIHTNAYNKKARGCEIFCHKFGGSGEKLARKVYSKVSALTPTSDRGVKQGYNFYGSGKHMYELAYTKAPASLVEVAFHDNASDAKWIINNIEPIGTAIAKGILEYFGISYKASSGGSSSSSKTLYRVMAGSFAVKSNAENQVKKLKKAGFDAVIMKYEK
jgi:N-acetylmuramoyl-L-alanine amidase